MTKPDSELELEVLLRRGRAWMGELAEQVGRLPGRAGLERLLEGCRLLVEQTQGLTDDLERREKAAVYELVAQALGERMLLDQPVALGLVLRLVEETDPRLLEQGTVANDELLTQARQLVVLIKVTYEYRKSATQTVLRRVSVVHLRTGRPVASESECELAWDHVPPDVREAHLRQAQQLQEFRLYPREEEPSR